LVNVAEKIVEVKVSTHAMEAQRRSRGVVVHVLNLSVRWGIGVQQHAPAALPPGKGLDTRCTGGPRVYRRKKSVAPTEI
jgi:hypothetical protein